MGSVRDLLRTPSLVVSVKPHAGLGNRMRVVLSGQSLAECELRSFGYSWPTGAPFGAELTELWRVGLPHVSPLAARALAVRYPFRSEKDDWRAAARGERMWQIRTGQPIALPVAAVPWKERLVDLVPVGQICDRVRTFFGRHLQGRPYVGVMIRAHEVSHVQSRELSPVDWFVNRMREMRSARPDTVFFLSCDVPEVQDRITAEFGETYGQSNKGDYNSKAAIISAVTDLYLLASSSHLLAPHYSSFPELALYLGSERVALETSVTDASAAWERRPVSMVRDPLRPWSS